MGDTRMSALLLLATRCVAYGTFTRDEEQSSQDQLGKW